MYRLVRQANTLQHYPKSCHVIHGIGRGRDGVPTCRWLLTTSILDLDSWFASPNTTRHCLGSVSLANSFTHIQLANFSFAIDCHILNFSLHFLIILITNATKAVYYKCTAIDRPNRARVVSFPGSGSQCPTSSIGKFPPLVGAFFAS